VEKGEGGEEKVKVKTLELLVYTCEGEGVSS